MTASARTGIFTSCIRCKGGEAMSRPLFVKVGGDQKRASQTYLKKDGEWRTGRLPFVKVGGAWEHTHDFRDYQYFGPATCVLGTHYRYNCPCGAHGDMISYGDALGHSYGGWVTDIEPTCMTEGFKSAACTRCGASVQVSLGFDLNNHEALSDFVTVRPSTCVEQGSEYALCSACSNGVTLALPIDPNNHERTHPSGYIHGLGEHTVDDICDDCNEVVSSVTERCTLVANGNYRDNGDGATHMVMGTCTVCGGEYFMKTDEEHSSVWSPENGGAWKCIYCSHIS